ncbi:serine/threonine-protein kinase [Tsukamurella tyrosinosolvens]|uniref:non-specific serine/threonine protein kinase n=1 Tax=Tsukamurella tyrosinosolvens TaxID=57704 RepID=A0A1H4TIZ2_TSUTY|nr:protein kinase [Tsukamurella tyrosinosolvens]SEC56220.1 Protein kinase domain-containing protein [Tsukamurella tyrosinosolvens]
MDQGESPEIGGYRIIRQLGSGGMGAVYLVQHPTLPRQEALKLLDNAISRDEDFRARFTREADLLAGLSHPNIVTLHNRGESEDGRLWLTMEYVDGIDAAALVRTEGPMPLDVALPVLIGAASALDYTYQRKAITHRDVKPANILVTFHAGRVEQVKLADFGIAKAMGESTSLTSTGITVGTMAFISPEAITDSTNITGAADQYSLAATAYALLTGAGPFESVGAPALMYDHLNTPVPSILARRPDLPAGVDLVFERALAKNPKDRYASCREFTLALKKSSVGQMRTSVTPIQSTIHHVQALPKALAQQPKGIDEAETEVARQPKRNGRSHTRAALAGVVIIGAVALSATALAVMRATGNSESPQELALVKTITVDMNSSSLMRTKGATGDVYLLGDEDGSVWSLSPTTYRSTVLLKANCARGAGLAASVDTQTAMRFCPDNNSVDVFDPGSGVNRASVAVAGRPTNAVVASSGNLAYVTSYDAKTFSNAVTRVNLTDESTAVLPKLRTLVPKLATNSDGSVLYANAVSDNYSYSKLSSVLRSAGEVSLSLEGTASSIATATDGGAVFVAIGYNSLQSTGSDQRRRVSVFDSSRSNALEYIDIQDAEGLVLSPDGGLLAVVTESRDRSSVVYLVDVKSRSIAGQRSIARESSSRATLVFDGSGRNIVVAYGSRPGEKVQTKINVLDATRR